jgi:hypothetical protein
MRALWLPDVLRGAGLTVNLYPGWSDRGADTDANPYGPLRGVICHATAGARTSTDDGEMRVLWVTGSTSAPAPISQLYLSRSGQWWVGATGRCNHVRIGDKGPHQGFGNDALIGVEAQNDNRGEPWSALMLDSYQRGVAAICARQGWPASVAVAHREHQTGKSDPFGVDMVAFRLAVARHLNPSPTPGGHMRLFGFAGEHWQSAGPYGRFRVVDSAEWADLVRIWGMSSVYPGPRADGFPVCALDEVVPGSDPPKRPDGGNPWTAADVLARFGPDWGVAVPAPVDGLVPHTHPYAATIGPFTIPGETGSAVATPDDE